MTEEITPEIRFNFLFPAGGRCRFRLFSPDLVELRWTIFDSQEKRTVGYGQTPEAAVDCALALSCTSTR